ncbi:MAG: UDP-N-acetylmuramate dehydrogenase [Chitinophagaceae bacterium]
MDILENFSLQKFNTFHINAYAKHFFSFNSLDQLHEILEPERPDMRPILVLGGGSNLLFTGNLNGLVLKNGIKGMQVLSEDDNYVYVKAGAGENWHQFVLYCIENNMAGVENLSLIPGNVGAGPMQNIGAYGVELKEVFFELEAFHLNDKKMVKFSQADCAFGYRESVFKTRFKNQFVIATVTFKLFKKPRLNTSYGAIEQELQRMNIAEPSIKTLSQAVINIRRSKLPDPDEIGNAGSFFKNPEVPAVKFHELQEDFPGIIGHDLPNSLVKLAAGWMIEQCGWKGYRKGDAGCHAKQALVLVNYGNASGEEIYDLSEEILQSVQKKFGIMLEREVNIF